MGDGDAAQTGNHRVADAHHHSKSHFPLLWHPYGSWSLAENATLGLSPPN
jgi:hypothetical protein